MNGQLQRGYLPVSEYAIIGDGQTAALVASDGSIDWFCWPDFDSPAVFLRILDEQKGGYFQVCPTGPFKATRSYDGDTNVLTTTFEVRGGRARLTDLMPARRSRPSGRGAAGARGRAILRLVEGLGGEVELEVSVRPTFDFGRATTSVVPAHGGAVARAGRQTLALACPAPLERDEGGRLQGRLRVAAGQRVWLGLTMLDGDEPGDVTLPTDEAETDLAQTKDHWHRWAATCEYDGPYRDLVTRSALTLKLLAFEPTGALVAAPTTSLPEQIGGVRNWDYRYTWLRDSALILEAMLAIGYRDEAHRFFDWLRSVWIRHHRDLRIMYQIDGELCPPERDLTGLDGYLHSRPVRLGNAAAYQTQLDVYGEVLDAAHVSFNHLHPPSAEVWEVLRYLADTAAHRWREPDRGIWEVRGGEQQFLYSKLLCWVALDRAIDVAQQNHLSGNVAGWRSERDRIREIILTQGFDARIGAFTRRLNGSELDASALAIPIVGFLPATDERVRSTRDRLREHLLHDGLLDRYHAPDGIAGGEGTFALCTFWLVDNYALAGEVDQARELFEYTAGFANDVGLLSEEIDPSQRVLLGNFPQGFSHLALIRSAYHLARAEAYGAEHQATSRSQRLSQMKQAGAGR